MLPKYQRVPGLPECGRGLGMILLYSSQKEHTADTLSPEVCLPGLWNKALILYTLTDLWTLVAESPRKY